MADISKLRNAKPEEVDRLKNNKIKTVDDLWAYVGQDSEGGRGITDAAELTGIWPQRLTELLAQQALHEIETGGSPWIVRHATGILLILVLVGVALLALIVRVRIAQSPPPVGVDEVMIAVHNLEAGQVVRADDLNSARLPPRSDYFTTTQSLHGLILSQAVPQGRPLRFNDVLRQQVVAARDLALGTLVESDAITLTWSIYQPDAVTQSDQALGRQTLRAIRSGEVILAGYLDSASASKEQVVVNTTTCLPAFHVITGADVMLAKTPSVTGAFTATKDIEGRYLLEPVMPGTVLRAEQLSSVHLRPEDTAGRYILSIPLRPGILNAAVEAGARVSLLFSSPNGGSDAGETEPVIVEDVLVLAVAPDGEVPSIVIALTAADRDTVVPRLGVSDVFILRSAP